MAVSFRLDVIARPREDHPAVPVFAIVRNERYFLPHFLAHYRALGVRNFWFLDDHSTDGTRELLASQPDCGVVASDRRFGDKLDGLRFSTWVRRLVPEKLFPGRWVLGVDCDEFLVLPPSFDSVDALAAALERHGLGSARAVMIDFFPRSLDDLAAADAAVAPFELCPYFDPLVSLDWRDREPRPRAVPLEGVRPRMLGELLKRVPTPPAWLASYKHALVHKSPLVHWQPGVRMRCPHEATLPPSDRVQLVLAHFKFYPGYDERIRAAVASGSYFDASIEYRFLAEACAALEACDLRGPASLRYDGPASLVASGMLFSRLPPAIGRLPPSAQGDHP
jgi:hypothetical protein